MDKIVNQITEHALLIDSIREEMKEYMNVMEELSRTKPTEPGPAQDEVTRQQKLPMRKYLRAKNRLPKLNQELGLQEDAHLALVVGDLPSSFLNEKVSTKQLLDATAELSRNLSTDPNQNPYWYSRRELLPANAAVAQKRTSMRARGKNPGRFKSNLGSYDNISQEQEGMEDQDLIRYEQERQARADANPVVRRGSKKKSRGKRSKHSKMRKPRRTSRHTKSIGPASSRHSRRSSRR